MHQCLNCKKYYEDDEVPIIEGCGCGHRVFLFIKNPKDTELVEEVYEEIQEKIKEIETEETEAEKEEGQQDLVTPPNKYTTARKAVRTEREKFGIETIKVKDIGIYEINIDALMRGRPIVVLSKSGSYIISLPSAFGRKEKLTFGGKTK